MFGSVQGAENFVAEILVFRRAALLNPSSDRPVPDDCGHAFRNAQLLGEVSLRIP
jgi:hypothetical protein